MGRFNVLPLSPIVLLCTALTLACSTDARSSHPLERTEIWQRYLDLSDSKALAIAGYPDEAWVAGSAGAQPTAAAAKSAALEECARQRARHRMQAPCILYALGAEVQQQNFHSRRGWP
jgi:hypothetical protein